MYIIEDGHGKRKTKDHLLSVCVSAVQDATDILRHLAAKRTTLTIQNI